MIPLSTTTKDNGTRSDYVVTKKNDMKGLRIKETFTFNAAGISGPLFFSVVLKLDEMPYNKCNKGFYLLKILGLCV